MNWYELWKAFTTALSTIKNDISENWFAYSTILIIYTIVIWLIIKQYYKHAREGIEYDRKLLDARKSEYDDLKAKYEKYKAEIDSPEYQAYLMAQNISKTDLSDVDMFSKKKKK